MFKSWRNDKNKIKAVFKLQFQATQVPKLKKAALMISLVPDDVGKPTFKLEKAQVKEGICSWENPIYVSVKLVKEPKSGIVREKIYHFVVATGSSKSGFLGEASIDFADFLTEAEPLTVSLPLKFANSGAVLNVTIEKIQGANDLKFIEENKDQTLSKEDSFKSLPSNDELEGYNQDERNINVNTAKNVGLGGSFDSIGESGWMDGSDGNARLPQRHNSVPATNNGHRRSNTDWSASSTSDESYIESRNSPENSFQRGYSVGTDSSDPVEKLKMELEALRRQSELSELEKQSLRKQAIKENKRIQELSREVNSLKDERDGAVEECEKLRLEKSRDEADAESRLRCVSEDSSNMIEEIRDELSCEKELTSNLKLQLQRTQESNSNLILAVRDLNELLEEKKNEISSLNRFLEETKKLEEDNEMDSGHNEEIDTLKQQIEDLDWDLESYKKKNEEQEILLDDLTREYESLKEENHKHASLKLESSKAGDEFSDSKEIIEELESQIEILEGKLKQQSLEYSECLITVNELESQVKDLKKELEDQARAFDEDLDTMMREKTEQEQRAIKAEENLRKTRWNNAITAERLQEKCKRLSLEMESKLSEHENLTTKTLAEANYLRLQNKNLEEMQEKAHSEITQEREMKKNVEEKNEALLMKVQMLEGEVLKLTKMRDESNAAATETEKIIQEWRKERDEFERKFALAKDEAMTAQKELTLSKTSNDEKETRLRNLKIEVEGLSVQYSELQSSFVQEKMENDELRKQVSNLKVDIRRKEEDMTKILDARMEARPQENGQKEENLTKLSDELAYCKNKNSSMERELKEMEERYSEISLRFAEVEGERQQLVMAVRNLKNGKKF